MTATGRNVPSPGPRTPTPRPRPARRPSVGALRGCAAGHLATYVDPRERFAFTTYDRWYGSPDVLTPLDCLAANLLGMLLRHSHVLPLFQEGQEPGNRLREAMQAVLDAVPADGSGPAFVDLDTVDDEVFQVMRRANAAAARVNGWAAMAVTKVLHRLRPQFVPLFDGLVGDFYGVERDPKAFFTALLRDLKPNRDWLEELADGVLTSDGRPVSILRVVDMVVWHHEKTGCQGAAGS